MQTAWGDIPVFDAHVHFFSSGFFRAMAAQKTDMPQGQEPLSALGATLGWQMPPAQPQELARDWARELDRHGVERAVLIASVPGDEESVAAASSSFPDRFYGYFMLNPLSAEAPERVRRALAVMRLRGICLFPAMHRFSIQDKRLEPILQIIASAPGTVIFVHCGVLTVGIRKKLGLPSHFDMRFSNPIDLHAVAMQYPQVNFLVPHFGAGYFREALMLCDLCPNVYLDTSSTNSWMRYQPDGIDLSKVFRRALDVATPKRLLFGSDSSFFPRGWHREIFETQCAALRQIGISEADAQLIFGENLKRLLDTAMPPSAGSR